MPDSNILNQALIVNYKKRVYAFVELGLLLSQDLMGTVGLVLFHSPVELLKMVKSGIGLPESDKGFQGLFTFVAQYFVHSMVEVGRMLGLCFSALAPVLAIVPWMAPLGAYAPSAVPEPKIKTLSQKTKPSFSQTYFAHLSDLPLHQLYARHKRKATLATLTLFSLGLLTGTLSLNVFAFGLVVLSQAAFTGFMMSVLVRFGVFESIFNTASHCLTKVKESTPSPAPAVIADRATLRKKHTDYFEYKLKIEKEIQMGQEGQDGIDKSKELFEETQPGVTPLPSEEPVIKAVGTKLVFQ